MGENVSADRVTVEELRRILDGMPDRYVVAFAEHPDKDFEGDNLVAVVRVDKLCRVLIVPSDYSSWQCLSCGQVMSTTEMCEDRRYCSGCLENSHNELTQLDEAIIARDKAKQLVRKLAMALERERNSVLRATRPGHIGRYMDMMRMQEHTYREKDDGRLLLSRKHRLRTVPVLRRRTQTWAQSR